MNNPDLGSNPQASHSLSTENNSASVAEGIPLWAPGAVLAIASGILYFAVRPPMFDSDGYGDLLAALEPDRLASIDPLHLLTMPTQIILVSIAGANPYPSMAPFQVTGIVLSCATLFFFCALLLRSSGSRLFAIAAGILVAFSPRFWYVTFQNKPYPFLCLALVLYLYTWFTPDETPPTGVRLMVAGFFMSVLVLFHQAAVFLVPAGVLALTFFGKQSLTRRLACAITWGAGVTIVVLAVYLYAWRVATGGDRAFMSWALRQIEFNGPPEFHFPQTLIQSVTGVFGLMLQDDAIRSFLQENLTIRATLAIYAGLGIFSILGVTTLIRWTQSNKRLLALARNNPLFTVSLLSICFWSVVVIIEEPVTSNHWVLVLFPGLVCLGLVLRGGSRRAVNAFAVIVLMLSGVNAYLNRSADLSASRNAPQRLVASIDRHLGKKDIFLVLANQDWYGDVEYELLFSYLRVASDRRGVAILNDFVLPAHGSRSWSDALKEKIDSTLNSGGQVFVAAHVLDADSYQDLGNSMNAFSPKEDHLSQQYETLGGPALLGQVTKVLNSYDLQQSNFKLADEEFMVIRRPAPHDD